MEVPVRLLFHEARNEKDVFEGLHTGKVVLHPNVPVIDTAKVPIYGILLLGGSISVNHIGGGMTVGKTIKLRALPRIGVLATQLR